MTECDNGTTRRTAELRHTNGPRTDAAGSMKADMITDDSTEGLDEEMEKRSGPKRCRNCG